MNTFVMMNPLLRRRSIINISSFLAKPTERKKTGPKILQMLGLKTGSQIVEVEKFRGQ